MPPPDGIALLKAGKRDVKYLADTLRLDVDFSDESGNVSMVLQHHSIGDDTFTTVKIEVMFPGARQAFCISYTYYSLEVYLTLGPADELSHAITLARSEPLAVDWLNSTHLPAIRSAFDLYIMKDKPSTH